MKPTTKKSQNYSDWWLDDITKRSVRKARNGKSQSEKDLAALASVKRSIAQFVHILTGKRLRVKFKEEGKESFTDGETVVVSSDIGPETYDQTVGIALHEGSHIVKTDFYIFKNIEDYIPSHIEDLADKKFGETEFLEQVLHKILNYVEDRRIDNWVFSTSPGYKGYYHSMYEAHWHNEKITERLKSDDFRDETMQSYMFRLINLTNDAGDLDALNGLREIHDRIDLDNIARLQSTEDVLEVSQDILEIIIENVNDIEFEEGGDVKFVPGEGDGDGDPIDWDELSEEEKEALKDAIEDQMDFLDGNIDKEPIDPEDAEELEALEDAGVSTHEVGEGTGNPHGIDCVVIDKLTERLVNKSKFPILKTYEVDRSKEAVNQGVVLGRKLGKKLKVRDTKRNTKFSRRKSGRLDQALLSEVGHTERLFYEEIIDEYDDAFVHISVDASGSMSNDKWSEAMKTCVAVAKACSMIGNVRVQISFRSTTSAGFSSGETKPLILMAYDSDESSFNHVKKYFPNINSGGTTPAGLTFEAIQEKILLVKDDEDGYFVNLSDGRPNFSADDFQYGSENGAAHTRKQVRKIKKKGIEVVAYFISSGSSSVDSAFSRMYGPDDYYIDPSNITQVSKTLNKKFLKEK